jgi:hypothetical protein
MAVFWSSGLQRHVDWYQFTYFSEVCTASINRVISDSKVAALRRERQNYKIATV